MDKKNILIFPSGWENALEIYGAVKYNVNVEVYGASGKSDYAEYAYDREHYIEGDFYIYRPDFLNVLNDTLERYQIDVIIPTHDDVCLFLAEHKSEIKAKILVADVRTAEVCRHKRMTYQMFSDLAACPKVYWERKDVSNQDFPLFLKPDVGAGAQGVRLVEKELDLTDDMFSEQYVLCENLPGAEFTIDCFTDRKRRLTFAGARSRDRIVMGMSYRSTTVSLTEDLWKLAETINERLSFFGCWYFQVKQDCDGNYKLLEVSCRASGGMSLYRHMGVNFHMMGIFELYEVDTSYVLLNSPLQMERRLFTKYHSNITYDTVYIDFDDTIIVRDKVCDVVIRFLYQCVNQGKYIVLLTRHDGNLEDILKKHRLYNQLFDEIIHLTFDEDKEIYIKPDRAIFIDNSYAERKKINEKLQIPVFDVDMVDMLLE